MCQTQAHYLNYLLLHIFCNTEQKMPKKGLIQVIKTIFFIAIFFVCPALQTNINFGHRLSGITVNGGTLTFAQATSNWTGTLDVRSGSIAGNNLFF